MVEAVVRRVIGAAVDVGRREPKVGQNVRVERPLGGDRRSEQAIDWNHVVEFIVEAVRSRQALRVGPCAAAVSVAVLVKVIVPAAVLVHPVVIGIHHRRIGTDLRAQNGVSEEVHRAVGIIVAITGGQGRPVHEGDGLQSRICIRDVPVAIGVVIVVTRAVLIDAVVPCILGVGVDVGPR